jgi:uncharacterized SAM-binding protein YcdF (DUF218 family)
MANGLESVLQGSVETLNEVPEHFDALVVLGKNWRAYPPTNDSGEFKLRLSIESKMSALAAGEMFRAGLINEIIFSSGKTAGRNYPSEAMAMKDFMLSKFPDIPDVAIVLEETSIDTPQNAEEVAKIINADPRLKKIALMTIKSHMLRSVRLFKEFGMDVKQFPSEDQLKKRDGKANEKTGMHSQHYRSFLRAYSKSGRAFKERAVEFILRNLLYIDSKGKIPRILTKKLRHLGQ